MARDRMPSSRMWTAAHLSTAAAGMGLLGQRCGPARTTQGAAPVTATRRASARPQPRRQGCSKTTCRSNNRRGRDEHLRGAPRTQRTPTRAVPDRAVPDGTRRASAPELHDMARRIATVGYYVLLPNLYYRQVPGFIVQARRPRQPPVHVRADDQTSPTRSSPAMRQQ